MPSTVFKWPRFGVAAALLPKILRAAASSWPLLVLPATLQSNWFSAPRLVSVSLLSKQYSNCACSVALPATPACGHGSWPFSTVVDTCSWPGAFCSTPIQIGFCRARLSSSVTLYWNSLISCQRHMAFGVAVPSPLMSARPFGKVASQVWFGPFFAAAGWPPEGYVAGGYGPVALLVKPRPGGTGSNGSSDKVQLRALLPP